MKVKKDLTREELYESVKTLNECESPHIQLTQQKLFTLFSISFQYFLYLSTKQPGAYVIRIEESRLAEKLARKSKDDSTRKFISKMLLPRKLKYGGSTFYVDFFNPGSWSITKDIPAERLKGALIIKNTNNAPLHETLIDDETGESLLAGLPTDYFLTSLTASCPKTITIAFDETFEGLEEIRFPFIKETIETVAGVKIASDLNVELE